MKPISEMSDSELVGRYHDLVYNSDSTESGRIERREEAARIRNELRWREVQTRAWMKRHPGEVEKIREKMHAKPVRVAFLSRTKVPKVGEATPVKVAFLGRLKKPKVRRTEEKG